MVGFPGAGRFLLAGAFALVSLGCTSEADSAAPATETTDALQSIDDIDASFGAYELSVSSTGDDQRHQLLRPAPVGLTESFLVTVEHIDGEGRAQAVSARLEAVVLSSAADGSATEWQGEWHQILGWQGTTSADQPDDGLTEELAGLEGATMTWWVDASHVVSQHSHATQLDALGFEARPLATELLDVPVLASTPLPVLPLGRNATWTGLVRSVDGAQTNLTGRTVMSHPDGYQIEVTLDDGLTSGVLVIAGVPGEPVPNERRLTVSTEAGAMATVTLLTN